MDKGVQGPMRLVVLWVGALLCGAIFGFTPRWITDSTGAAAPMVLLAAQPAKAILAVLAALVAATILGAFVGRLTNAAVGLFVLGCGLGVLSLRSGSIERLAFHPDGSLRLAAIECVGWAAAILVATAFVFFVAGPLHDIDPTDDDGRPVSWRSFSGFAGALAGLLVVPAIWIIAQSPMKGQTLMAAVLGGMVAGAVARMIRPHPRPVLVFAAACLFGAVALVIAASSLGATPLDVAFVKAQLSSLGRVMPIDYAAGSLIGVSMGLGIGKSMTHHSDAHVSTATA